ETLVHTVTIAAPYGVYLLVRKRHDVVRAIAFAAAAGVVALALTAVQLMPLMEAMPQAREYQYRHNYWRFTVHEANAGEQRARLLSDVIPYFLGRHWRDPSVTQVPFDSLAVGSLILPLAFYGLLRSRANERWFFLAVILFSVPARLGLRWFGSLMRPFPGLDMAINERFAFAAAFALAILAAFGVEAWLDRPRDAAIVVSMLAVALGLGIATWYFVAHDPTDAAPGWTSAPIAGELIPIFAAIAIIALLRPAIAAPSLLVLFAVQRLVTVGMIYPTLPARVTYPDVPMFSVMRKTHEPFRVVGVGASLIPATAAVYGLEDVRGYSALTLMRYIETFPLWCKEQAVWWNRVDDLTTPFLSFLNVRYAITGLTDPPPGWHVVAEQFESRILENERVLPRAFIPEVATVGRFSGADMTLAEMRNESDFRHRAWIDAPMPIHEEQNGPGEVTKIEPRGNGFGIDVTMQRAGRVVVSEEAWDGWRAYIDGRRVQMQIANLAFLAIYVPAGSHTLRLIYLPDSFVIGRAISLFTLVFLLILPLALRWRDRRYIASRENQLS
ncbi:MAG TPA: YfhO family protein, partial [Thermoanaerobaculia bacterium]|nr:YfhO family protein [Thermoanaerobaculia bacterium]